MNFFDVQNPGIGGLDELTTGETIVIQTIAGFGTPLQALRTNAAGNAVEWFTLGAGTGTVTNTGGNLTSNSIVLGAGTVDTKVSTGITTDGTSKLILGVNTTTLGSIKLFGNTSGDVTLQPNAVAGTGITLTLPATTGTVALLSNITGTNSGTNTGDQTSIVGITGTMSQFDTAVSDGNIVYQGQALGTPSSGTVTNLTGTASININGTVGATTPTTGSFTTITTSGNIELGNASDTTLSRSAAGVIAVEGIRIKTTTPLIVSAASYTTDTGTSLNMDNLDHFVITAQAGALLFNSPGGTLVQGRSLVIRIKDNGTARALTWNAVFRAIGTPLPSTTVLSKTLYLGFFYNSTDTKWDLVCSAQES